VARLRAVALRALASYGLTDARVRLLQFGFNALFRVDAADGRFALRLNVNSHRSLDNVTGELAWIEALGRETSLTVPTPRARPDGQLVALVDAPEVGRPLPATLFAWIPGRDLGARDGAAALHALGGAMATLHTHGAGWSLPAGAALPHGSDLFMGQPPSILAEQHPELPSSRQAVFVEAHRHAAQALAALYAEAPQHLVHFDLHTWNVKWRRGQLAVFDFDDCAIACAVHDLAITTYYLRSRPRGAMLEEALRAGYAGQRTLPACPPERFEALLLARLLLLANDLFRIEHADDRAQLPRYLAQCEAAARRFLATGRFAPAASAD
jgi:Ser/Thr protein kinase RdoA (MazF antagonist)